MSSFVAFVVIIVTGRVVLARVCEQAYFSCNNTQENHDNDNADRAPIDVLVSSPGGVGSTVIIQLVEQLGLTAFESDWTKHPLAPPNRPQYSIRKAVYCYRDAISSVFSLLRRDYFNGQIRWLTNGQCQSTVAFTDAILEQCIKKNEHVILHQTQFQRWMWDRVAYDRLFLNTTALYAGDQAVAHNLCVFISKTQLDDCLRLLHRVMHFGGTHTYSNISTRYPNIFAAYKEFNQFLHFLPPLFVMRANA